MNGIAYGEVRRKEELEPTRLCSGLFPVGAPLGADFLLFFVAEFPYIQAFFWRVRSSVG